MKTMWDFSNLTKEDFTEERKKILEAHKKFNDKWKTNPDYLENPEILKEALDEYKNLEEKFSGKEYYYYHLKEEQNQNDLDIRAKFGNVRDFMKSLGDEVRFFILSLGKIPEEKQKQFLEYDSLSEYKQFLKIIFENAKYRLSESEEKILVYKSNSSYRMWVQMTESFLAKETRKVLDDDKKLTEKTYPEMLALMQSQDREIRDSSAKAFNEILEKYSEVAEFELNAILEDKKIEDQLRGFSRPDEARHKSDLIETETVDSLIEAVSKRGFEISKKFYELKSKILKIPKFDYSERNLNYEKNEKDISYDESVKLIEKVFANLDDKFLRIFKNFSDNGQIDAFPKKGKNGGAFCAHWSLKTPTYILLNHTNKLRDVQTIAHEVGHGINNELMREKQNALYFDTPLSTAEVASTFMEDFVFQELLETMGQEGNDEEKLSILMQKLQDDVSSIMRQIALYNFEKEIHETYRKENYLPKEKINEIFIKHMSSYLGDFVDVSKSGNWWVYWSHIRQFFYVYSYASGLLISKSMQNLVKQDHKNIEKVKTFLATGTSKYPKEIFAEMGIDISKKEFWNKGLDEVQNLLNETENLAKKLGKI